MVLAFEFNDPLNQLENRIKGIERIIGQRWNNLLSEMRLTLSDILKVRDVIKIASDEFRTHLYRSLLSYETETRPIYFYRKMFVSKQILNRKIFVLRTVLSEFWSGQKKCIRLSMDSPFKLMLTNRVFSETSVQLIFLDTSSIIVKYSNNSMRVITGHTFQANCQALSSTVTRTSRFDTCLATPDPKWNWPTFSFLPSGSKY